MTTKELIPMIANLNTSIAVAARDIVAGDVIHLHDYTYRVTVVSDAGFGYLNMTLRDVNDDSRRAYMPASSDTVRRTARP
jgi:hypothetical protein